MKTIRNSISRGSLCATLLLSALTAAAQSAKDTSPLIPTVEIPAGTFYMGGTGAGENYDEAPMHRVTITRPFRMGVTEVTNAQYEQFRPEHRKLRGKRGFSSGDDEAVVFVSYDDAVAFCRWLSEREGKTYRLPTEAEWEYACRAGTMWNFWMGDRLLKPYMKNQAVAPDPKPLSLQVAQQPANPWGLHDMSGNVEEWCADWYGPYMPGWQTDPVGPADGLYRVTRGGSHNTPMNYLRSANRSAMIPDDMGYHVGFRVVQADYPTTEPLPVIPDTYALTVSHEQCDWDAQRTDKPVFEPYIVYVKEPAPGSGTPFYSHNHQPAITWCPNGDLLAIWFSTDEEKGRELAVLSSRLRRGSHEWEPARLFFKVPDRNMTGSALLNDGRGTLYHINGVEALGGWKNLAMTLRTSTDDGATWTKPRLIAPEHTLRHQVIAGTMMTREGWIVQACDAGSGGADGAAVHISKDGGQTWIDPWDGAPLPKFAEGATGTTIAGIHAGVVQLKDGRLMAMGRNNNIKDKEGRLRMPVSISDDMGKTWTYHASPLPPIDGGQRLVLMRLQEGPLLLVSFTGHPFRTSDRDSELWFTRPDGTRYRGHGLYAAVSYDEGRTWETRRLLTDGRHELLNAGAWTQWFEADDTHAEPRGYLAGTQTPDGMIHIVSSRFYYRFNLPWLEEVK